MCTALRLRLALVTMTFLTLTRLRAFGSESVAPSDAPRGEPPGCDVFVIARAAVLRDKPSRESRFLATLPAGSRLRLIESLDQYLRVEVASATPPALGTDGLVRAARSGWLAREVAAVFPPGAAGSDALAATGRRLSAEPAQRGVAAAYLLRAADRFREEGRDTPEIEILLGDTAEALAAAGGPFPPGIDVARRACPSAGKARWRYTGDAFRRALSLSDEPDGAQAAALLDRAKAGVVRQEHPRDLPPSLEDSSKETADWLALVQCARDAGVLRAASDRLATASLDLARSLLAAGRAKDLELLERQLSDSAAGLSSVLDDPVIARFRARAALVHAMRGDGSRSFPQEARVRIGPKTLVVRVDAGRMGGAAGSLELTSQATVGGTRVPPRRRFAVPVLPVPGSLTVSPDGRSAAWIEVKAPSRLVAVVAPLDTDAPAREIAPGDRAGSYLLSALTGYSRDGQRLGVSTLTGSGASASEPRYCVVSSATGDLVFETSRDLKSFRRLIE